MSISLRVLKCQSPATVHVVVSLSNHSKDDRESCVFIKLFQLVNKYVKVQVQPDNVFMKSLLNNVQQNTFYHGSTHVRTSIHFIVDTY